MKEHLTKIWDKDKSDQVMYLMRETFARRRLKMKGFIERPMFRICANYAMLKESKYVSKYNQKEIYACVKNSNTIPKWVT